MLGPAGCACWLLWAHLSLRARWLCLLMQLLLPLLPLLPVTSPLNGTAIVRTWFWWQSWSAVGLWLAKGSDCQSCVGNKAPCGGRPRSVWNPPHGPVPPRACSIRAFGVAKQERGLALATGGFGAEVAKSSTSSRFSPETPTLRCPQRGWGRAGAKPAPGPSQAGAKFEVGRPPGAPSSEDASSSRLDFSGCLSEFASFRCTRARRQTCNSGLRS